MNTIETRIEKLESANRSSRKINLILSLVLITVILMAFRKEAIPDKIQARSFEVVGKNGKTAVRIEAVGGGNIHTFDADGHEGLYLGAMDDGSGAGGGFIYLKGYRNNIPSTSIELIASNADHYSTIGLGPLMGKTIQLEASRYSRIQVNNSLNQTLCELGADGTGGGQFFITNNNGKRIAGMGVDIFTNGGECYLMDENGKETVKMVGGKIGGGAIEINGKEINWRY